MQTSLFSNAFPQQEQGIEFMKDFDFPAALECLQAAKELNADLPNNRIYTEAASFCLAKGFDEKTTPEMIVAVWETLHQKMVFAANSTVLRAKILEIIAERLLAQDAFDARGLLRHDDQLFHISACHMHTKQYEQARHALAHVLDGDVASLPARYWGYYGDAALALHRGREANLGYVRLFASNPFDVDWATFRHKELRSLFLTLQRQRDLQETYGCWPFYAWIGGLIEIPKANRYLAEIAQKNLKKLQSGLPLTPFEKQHRFSLLVFCDQSGDAGAANADLRKMMKELDEQKFQEYLNFL